MQHLRNLGLCIAATAALAGCGGGGGSSAAPAANTVAVQSGSDVPESAATSVTGVVAFLMTLIAGSSETAEPITVGNATLATSDTAEPEPIAP